MIGSLRPAPESLLGIDVGTAFTKAALFEPVEGQYRLVAKGQARTTSSSHVLEGVAQACRQIEELTGRRLFAAGELIAGDVSGGLGVDIAAASVSCQRPLRVLATNAATGLAARSERCIVVTLDAAKVEDQARLIVSQPWDAVVGVARDMELAQRCLEGDAAPEFISGDSRTIQARLAEMALNVAEATVPGFGDLTAGCTERVVTGSSALLSMAMLIATRFGLRLAIADCGASQTTIAYASPDSQWLRTAINAQSMTDVPSGNSGITAMHRAMETSLQACAEADMAADLLLGSGALARFNSWGQTALTMLDGLRPAGVIQFGLDSGDIVTQVAPFAASLPDVASRIFEQDGLTGLGAAVCPRGTPKRGAKALEVRWKGEDGSEAKRVVNGGELVRIPLASGTKANLSLFPVKPMDVGLNRPGMAATAQVDGGRVGLIVDARLGPEAGARDRWEAELN